MTHSLSGHLSRRPLATVTAHTVVQTVTVRVIQCPALQVWPDTITASTVVPGRGNP